MRLAIDQHAPANVLPCRMMVPEQIEMLFILFCQKLLELGIKLCTLLGEAAFFITTQFFDDGFLDTLLRFGKCFVLTRMSICFT
jgi:hypothetical protein